MEIRVLRYFLAVARLQSFSKAAQFLNVTQPTLSKQIKDLEDEYHITLFERTTRSLSLTREGLLFKEQAKEIISLVDKAEALLKQKENNISGDIHIGCSEIFLQILDNEINHARLLPAPGGHYADVPK